MNDTLIVRCELDDGSVGWGEGLPRPYVTGESIDSVWRHMSNTDMAQLADRNFSEPLDAVTAIDDFRLADIAADPGLTTRECFGNSPRCAIEVALLYAVCRSDCCTSQICCDHFPKRNPFVRITLTFSTAGSSLRQKTCSRNTALP